MFLQSQNNRAAFTMLELAVVISIIAILIAGVAGTFNIVDNARITRFSAEIADIKRSVTSFREIYNAWPGDYNGVGTYDSSDSKCDTPPTNNDIWPNICKGDANSIIELQTTNFEAIYARNHLIFKELLPSAFSRRFQSLEPQAMKLTKSYGDRLTVYLAGDQDFNNSSPLHPKKGIYKNRLYVRDAASNMTNPSNFTPLAKITLSPELALNIDRKFDDSNPIYGNIWGGVALGNNTTVARNCLNNSNYNTSSSYEKKDNVTCILRFELD